MAGGTGQSVLQRLHPDGSLDTFFGTGGQIISDAGYADYAVAVDPAGRAVTAGVHDGELRRHPLHRPRPPDPRFGRGGQVVTDLGGVDAAYAVAVAPDGSVVAAGTSDGSFAFARYLPNGSPDRSFGNGGVKLDPTRQLRQDVIGGVAFTADGKIVAVGGAVRGERGGPAPQPRRHAPTPPSAPPAAANPRLARHPRRPRRRRPHRGRRRPKRRQDRRRQPHRRRPLRRRPPQPRRLARRRLRRRRPGHRQLRRRRRRRHRRHPGDRPDHRRRHHHRRRRTDRRRRPCPRRLARHLLRHRRQVHRPRRHHRRPRRRHRCGRSQAVHIGDLFLHAYGGLEDNGKLIVGASQDSSTPTSSSLRRLIAPGAGSLGTFGNVPAAAGAVSRQPQLTFVNADGTTVTLTLKGGGSGQALYNDDRIDLVLTGTAAASILSIRTAGGAGRVTLGDVRSDGPMSAIVAETADLAGTLFVAGGVGKVALGSVTGALGRVRRDRQPDRRPAT